MNRDRFASIAALSILTALCGCQSTVSTSQDTSAVPNLPAYDGPRARVLLDGFTWGVQGSGMEITHATEDEDGNVRSESWGVQHSNVTSGLEASLKSSLTKTKRFVVSDRRGMKKLKSELRLKDQGMLAEDAAPEKGQVKSGDILVQGTVLEWDDHQSGQSAGVGGWLPPLPGVGGLKLGKEKGVCVIQIDIVDMNTMDTLASEQVRGEAESFDVGFGGLSWAGGVVLAGGFSEYEKKPMGKAIRMSIAKAIELVVDQVPQDYYKY